MEKRKKVVNADSGDYPLSREAQGGGVWYIRGDEIERLLGADKLRVSDTAQRTDPRKMRQRSLSREGDQTSVERTVAKRSPNDDIRRRPCSVEPELQHPQNSEALRKAGSATP